MKCPYCGSDRIVKAGNGVVAGYKVVQRYQCQDCHRTTTKPKE